MNLVKNKITEIKGFTNLTKIEILFLNYNHITEIKGLETLINLKRLNLKRSPDLGLLLKKLGGLAEYGWANYPQRFVRYCRKER